MRILLVTPFPPDPEAPHGGGVALGTLAEGLSRGAEIGLATIASAAEAGSVVTGTARWKWSGSARFSPRPSGPARLPHQLRMLWRWRTTPLVAAKIAGVPMPELLRRARLEFQPDVAMVEMAQMAQFLPALAGIPTILTDHEAGCPANTVTGLGSLADQRDRRLWWRFVRRFYPLATNIQTLTAEDAAVLSEVLDGPIGVRPPVFPVPDSPVHPDRAPARALFFGDYAHSPNPEAAGRLVREVLPRLRTAHPEAELWLAGPNDDRIRTLGSEPGVRLLGFVPDLRELLGQVRVLLAPLFSGAGLRIKCLTALAHGLPVVTNALGARGVDAPAPARTIAESSQALADATLAMLRSPSFAADAGRAGHEWARAHLHVDAVARTQIERCAALLPA